MDDVNVNATPTETPEVQPNIGDIEKLTCPRCGKRFDPKEKNCPYCGLKNNLKLCPTCGATIAKDAKHCPKCGAKNKKPIFKKIWVWAIVVLLGCCLIAVGQTGLLAGTGASPEEAIVGVWKVESAYDENMQEITLSEDEKNLKVVFDENHKAVLIAAGLSLGEGEWKYKKTDINGNMVYSITEGNGDFEIVGPRGKYKEHQGKLLMENDGQVLLLAKSTSEKAGDYTSVTSLDDFVDAVNELAKSVDDIGKENIVVTQGMKNALQKADDYLNLKAFSRYKLIEQLEYNGFSVDEAEYAADNCGADWNEQAARKAAEYLNMQAFSRERLKEQLRFEGFSPTQIEYGLKQNGY